MVIQAYLHSAENSLKLYHNMLQSEDDNDAKAELCCEIQCLLRKKREIDEEIEKHQQKSPYLDNHCKIIDNMMQKLATRQAADSQTHPLIPSYKGSSASSSDCTCPTSITADAAETSSATTAASTD